MPRVGDIGLLAGLIVVTGMVSMQALATTEPTSTSGRGLPGRSVEVSEVGAQLETDTADVSLVELRTLRPPDGPEAGDGTKWIGLRVEICVRSDATTADGELPWSSWLVHDTMGRAYAGAHQEWGDYPAQQLPETVAPGDCASGWVVVPMQAGSLAMVHDVAFDPAGPERVDWVV